MEQSCWGFCMYEGYVLDIMDKAMTALNCLEGSFASFVKGKQKDHLVIRNF